MYENFGEHFAREHVLASYIKYSRDDVLNLLQLYDFRVFTAHIYSLPTLPFDEYPHLRAFSFVRSPVDKAASAYFYLRNRTDTCSDHPAKTLSPAEFFQQSATGTRRDSFWMDSGQVDWLMGVDQSRADDVQPWMSGGQFHLFPTERFNEACVLMESLWPDDFRDCSYESAVNVSVRDRSLTENDQEALNRLPWLEQDSRLHQMAHQHLDGLIKQQFDSRQQFDQALQRFEERCRRRKPAEPPAAALPSGGLPQRLRRVMNRLTGRTPQ